MKKINKKELISWAISVFIFFLVLSFWLIFHKNKGDMYESSKNLTLHYPQSTKNFNTNSAGSFSGAAFRIRPAVVTICTTGINTQNTSFDIEAIGSGTIINSLGYIVTSIEAIKHKQNIQVVMYEPTHYEGKILEQNHHHIFDATVVTSYPAKGIAILKIEGPALPFANLHLDENIGLGNWCMAVGAPLGQMVMASVGLINQTNANKMVSGFASRGLYEISCKKTGDMIGGPLVNKQGEVIGIIVTKGYACPITSVLELLGQSNIPVM